MKPLRFSRGRVAAFYATVIGAGLVVASAADIWPLRLVYNASASVPLGFYAVHDAGELAAGDLVIAHPPLGFYAVHDAGELAAGDLVIAHPPLRAEQLLVERRYLGVGVPLVKQIGAVPGSTVCRDADRITIDGTPAAVARDADGLGRTLPRWTGCRQLGPGDAFLLNSGVPGSFDGRYFGPSPARDIVGKATPLWTW